MINEFKTINTGNVEIQQIQDNVKQSFNDVSKSLIIDGSLLKNITLTMGQDNKINHGLGRKLQFWIIVRIDTDTNIYETEVTQTTLTLQTSATCNVSLWVG